MKKIKITFVFLSLLTIFSLSANAQTNENSDKPGRAGGEQKQGDLKGRIEEMKAKLGLTPEQDAKIQEISKKNREEFRTRMQAIPKDAQDEARRNLRKEMMNKTDDEILELLTTEQQTIYKAEKEKMKSEMRDKMKEGRREGKGRNKKETD